MLVKIINEKYDYTATEKVNNFLNEIKNKYEVIDIVYKVAGLSHAGFNCIMIIYKDIEK